MPRSRRNVARPRAAALDRRLGERIRQRRITLGLSQQQLADLIGVTYQQQHKYEKGINRVSAGRLYALCTALNWSFAEALADLDQQPARRAGISERRMIELAENLALLDEETALALMAFVRVLARRPGGEP